MEINAKHINELAKEMGFIRDNLEKMARLLQMLDVLFCFALERQARPQRRNGDQSLLRWIASSFRRYRFGLLRCQ